MLKSARFFTAAGILVIVALVGGLYHTSKSAVNQEPIKIYRTVTPIKSTQVSKNSATENNASTDVSPLSDHIHEHAPQYHIPDGTDDFSVNEAEREDQRSKVAKAPMASEVTEEANHNDSVDEDFDSVQQFHEQMERLVSQIQSDYPELLALQNMTLEEMEALSPKEKQRISELSQQFLNEIGEIRNIVSQLPPGHVENILSVLQETYKEQWGSEITDRSFAEVRARLE